MAHVIQELGIDRLTREQRLDLIGEIWDSLDSEEDTDFPEEHKAIIDARLTEADANPGDAQPWEEVLERLRTRQ